MHRKKSAGDNISSGDLPSSPYSPHMGKLMASEGKHHSFFLTVIKNFLRGYLENGSLTVFYSARIALKQHNSWNSDQLPKPEPKKSKSKSNISSRLESIGFAKESPELSNSNFLISAMK